MNKILEGLNDRQLEAVTTTEGPVLVIAGAGSGKTTVLVRRMAYIISELKVSPYNILAITFTNKAADEMKKRISDMLGDVAQNMWIGTFHSRCVRILRSCIDRLGFGRDFVIYDSADTKTLLKECYREENIDENKFPLQNVRSIISNAKNDVIDENMFKKMYEKDFRLSVISKIYTRYQDKLRRSNALDFDDIILYTVKILSTEQDILERYQDMFKYIMIDEYQDTNNLQYLLVNLLSQKSQNICVVGDDDQSIYKFRGANIGNILNFEDDYPDAKRITLDKNYRSTQNILDVANTVIANNKKRMGKELWTDNDKGEQITTITAYNEYDEAHFVATQIKKHCNNGGLFSDCAILYRTNAQSRVIEEQFLRAAVPYRVLAGMRFYDRKEIKDILSYLRIIYNHNDDVSLIRIINEPKRKIGKVTLDKAKDIALSEKKSIYYVIERCEDYPELHGAATKLKEFAGLINSLTKLINQMPLEDFIQRVWNDSGYMAMLMADNSMESKTRIENLDELLNSAAEFEKNEEYDGTLGQYLESISLISDIDAYDEDVDSAVLMTIHSAKGLEFPVVFVVGMEEGLFPSMRSLEREEDIEEERRLCYVAITRAKNKLYITKAQSRTSYGKTVSSQPSRFFRELPKECIVDESSVSVRTVDKIRQTGFNNYVPPMRKPSYSSPADKGENVDFFKGDIVEHRKFGRGVVISAKSFGSDSILVINFDTIGEKQLMAAFAKLKKIEE